MPPDEPSRSERPLQDLSAMGADMARLWQEMAKHASDIAHSKRVLFLAYVAEGFSEAQALELITKV